MPFLSIKLGQKRQRKPGQKALAKITSEKSNLSDVKPHRRS